MISGFTAAFMILGLVVSVEDWQERRIRNRWIALGMILCGAGLAYLLLNSLLGYRGARFAEMGEYYLPWHYYPRVLAHLALSLAAALTLWRMSVWPAGDAKLYTLYSFFTALINPNLPGFPLLLFLVILVNIFVPAGLVFAAETVLKGLLRLPELAEADWRKSLKAAADTVVVRLRQAWPRHWQWLALFTNLFCFFFLMRWLERRYEPLAPGPFGHLLVFLLMFVGWSRLVRLLSDPRAGLAALVAVSGASCFGTFALGWNLWDRLVEALRLTINFSLFLTFAKTAFYWVIERQSLRGLAAEELKCGVILSDETWERLKAEKSLEGVLGGRYSDGLTEEEAQGIKAWLAARQPDGCTFYQAIPFAAWVFLGTVLTLSNRGNAVRLLTPYLEKAWAVFR